jgi:hypothetical protein
MAISQVTIRTGRFNRSSSMVTAWSPGAAAVSVTCDVAEATVSRANGWVVGPRSRNHRLGRPLMSTPSGARMFVRDTASGRV